MISCLYPSKLTHNNPPCPISHSDPTNPVKNSRSLETLYANGNQIQTIPSSLSRLQKLKKVQLSNNDISVLPIEFTQRFGEVEDTTGILKKDAAVSVLIIGNPIVEKLLDEEKRRAKEEKEGQKNGGMEVEELTTETEGSNAEVMDTN